MTDKHAALHAVAHAMAEHAKTARQLQAAYIELANHCEGFDREFARENARLFGSASEMLEAEA